MVALRERDRSGSGQVVDVNLLESMLQLMSALPSAAAHLDYDQPRLGSGIPYSVPRGTYRCADGRWVAVSTSAESVAHRVLTLVGVADDPRFATFEGRATHREELDRVVAEWIAARPQTEVIAAFEHAHAAIAPVYTMRELLRDPHVRERGVFVDVDGIIMQGPTARFDRTPAQIRHAGRALDADAGAQWHPRDDLHAPGAVSASHEREGDEVAEPTEGEAQPGVDQ
jgi:crotonobetainyl-CoA:carnitine CoA-transferase CaiB-like acyl-CoA transferase